VHWQSWDLLKTDKVNGGLGFRDLLAFNKPLLSKQTWRLFQQPHLLWCRLFKGLYFHTKDIHSAELGTRPSWGWRSVLFGRDAILPNVRWFVGDGKNIKIRDHSWLPSGPIEGPATRDKPRLVADLIDPLHHTWNVNLITQLFNDDITSEILDIRIRPLHATDQIVWIATKDDHHIVKSNYRTIVSMPVTPRDHHASSSYQQPSILWRKLGKINTTQKIRLFLWSACHNALPTKANLFSRHIISDPICEICNQHSPETIEHILLLLMDTRDMESSADQYSSLSSQHSSSRRVVFR